MQYTSESGRTSGFTLIELSILLVIIGLIVGGVLVGQELISAATVRAQVTQIEKYNTAVNTFRDKYGGIPGDLGLPLANQFGFDTIGCDGTLGHRDGNGLIDGWSQPFLLDQPIGETGVFWQDLSANTNLIEGTYPNGNVNINGCNNSATPITSATAGSYFPPAKIGRGNFVYVYETNGYNWFGLSAIMSADGAHTLYSNANIPVIQAYNIDKKMDDGLPLGGNVMATYINAPDGNAPLATPANAPTDTATSCYNTNNQTYSLSVGSGAGLNCALSFRFQ